MKGGRTHQANCSHFFFPPEGDFHRPPARTWDGMLCEAFGGLCCLLRQGRFKSRFSHIVNGG